MTATYSAKDNERLLKDLLDPEIALYPERFVQIAHPWGKAGTVLEQYQGPRQWQHDFLVDLGAHIRRNMQIIDMDQDPDVFQRVIAGGRGAGKTALYGMLSHYGMTCFPGSTTMVAANTRDQLSDKTFPELRQWFAGSVNAHFFELGTTYIRPAKWYAEQLAKKRQQGGLDTDPAYHYVQEALWSADNPSAFRGTHNRYGLAVLMDEADGIPSVIWDQADGFFTERAPFQVWIGFANPGQNSGGFHDRFHKPEFVKHWKPVHINSLMVEGINKKPLLKIIEQYGEDSDQARVFVYGQFPRAGFNQFIPNDWVEAAMNRALVRDHGAPLVMGVDVADGGADSTVAVFRQGPDARTIPAERWSTTDLRESADRVGALIELHRPDEILIDWAVGVGLVALLKERKFRNVVAVKFGEGADDPQWANKRTEMYGRLKAWLPFGCLPNDAGLKSELTAPDYRLHGKGKAQVLLEPKPEFKARIGRSPDHADALALTFAAKVARRDQQAGRGVRPRVAQDVDYPVFG